MKLKGRNKIKGGLFGIDIFNASLTLSDILYRNLLYLLYDFGYFCFDALIMLAYWQFSLLEIATY